MKKLGLIVLVAGIVLMAGCAGDDPAGPSGTLPAVTGLAIGTSSAGRNVDLSWNAVDDVDGYKIYFRASSTGAWTDSVDVTSGTSGQHANATSAGYYTVKAYEGNNYSENNSNIVNTLPTDVSTTYTIYDNYSAVGQPSGFIFGTTAGQTGSASSGSFEQDIYAFDEDAPILGDLTVRLYTGDKAPFGTGKTTYMAEPDNTGYCDLYPTGTWHSAYSLNAGDVRVFLYLENGHYVKMYNIVVTEDTETANGTKVSFSYEIQTGGLTLFTSN
ncbi:MAG: hypothetical protein KAT09_00560 [Candidatus Aegiribacteria sp.]|nr:hypothetical protein [Candidatus Aegiribacteria sp.]